MNYLERNAAFVEEINNKTSSGELTLLRGHNHLIFTSVGKYQSDVLDGELYLGIKEPRRFIFEKELGIVTAIVRNFPHLSDEVPVVFARVTNKAGTELGMLMEDFSRGGQDEVLSVTEDQTEVLPLELQEIFPADKEDIAAVPFIVGKNNRRRLGDFNNITARLNIRQRGELLPSDEIIERMEDFTVAIDARKHLR